MDDVQAILLGMRLRFIEELPERCEKLENLILQLEQTSGDHAALGELLREVHSLKGAGGTHGLEMVTTVCHQLEDLLGAATASAHFEKAFASAVLAHVDALRRVASIASGSNPDFGPISTELAKLRQSVEERRWRGLVVEASVTMARIYQAAVGTLPVDISVASNGAEGLARLMRDPFDFVILGGEIGTTSSIELATTLRASLGPNCRTPLILVTGSPQATPALHPFHRVVVRDQSLADDLLRAVAAAIAK